jgi:uncharacterized membrane protein YkgB
MNKTEYYVYLFSRFALGLVFVWFGALKVIDQSPANPLVAALLEQTLPFITFGQFIVWFGLFEVLIGILFWIPKAQKFAIALLVPHMITTVGPLVLLPSVTWTAPLVPTMEGQYIIKNVVIIALAAAMIVDSGKKRPR